ncbi:MAG: hypothetical protein AB9872_16260 [Solidesulfovibrio sp.]
MLDRKDDHNTSIAGDGNIYVGGDLIKCEIPDDSSISDKLRECFKHFDEQVNYLYPVISISKSKGMHKKFSSEKLVMSLSKIGIPILVGINILHSVCESIEILKTIDNHLNASDLRQFVLDALYNLKLDDNTQDTIQKWANDYIRRYGNPNRRIAIIFDNGSRKELKYDYVKNELIPEIINSIQRDIIYQKLKKIISQAEIDRMAAEVIESIKSLSIYRIHFSTLFHLTKELALQPPHPWMVKESFDIDALLYDYTNAKSHIKKLEILLRNNNYRQSYYAAKEALHHSCSTLLGRYGMFLGCGDLAPFYNLRNLIKELDIQTADILDIYPHANILKKDIEAAGSSTCQLRASLDRCKKLAMISSHDNKQKLSDLSIEINKIYKIVDKIAYPTIAIHHLNDSKQLPTMSDEFIVDLLANSLSLIPSISVRHDYTHTIWLELLIDRPMFRHISPQIATTFIINKYNNLDAITTLSNKIKEQLSEFVNTILVFANNKEQAREFSNIFRHNGIKYVLFMGADELCNIIESPTRDKIFFDCLVSRILSQ